MKQLILFSKIFIIRFLFFLGLISCNSKKADDMKFYENTEQFNEIQNSLNISFLQAKNIFIEYHNTHQFKNLEPIFYYYCNHFYYFGYKTDASRDKRDKSLFFMELKIDANTGKIEVLDETINWQSIK